MVTGGLPLAAFGLGTGQLIALVLFGGGGIVAVGWGSLHFRDGYQIWSHEPVDAATVERESGVVEVTGETTPLEDTVTAPYSNEECLVYEHRREERQHDVTDDDEATEWRTVDSGSDRVPFAVADDTGQVPVDPEGADVSLDDRDYSSSTQVRELEGRLDVGETVHVFGHARSDGDGQLGDVPTYVGDGDEVNYRIADTTGSKAVRRLLLKGTGAIVFGIAFIAVAVYVVNVGLP